MIDQFADQGALTKGGKVRQNQLFFVARNALLALERGQKREGADIVLKAVGRAIEGLLCQKERRRGDGAGHEECSLKSRGIRTC